MKHQILLINTGGTIGMIENPCTPVKIERNHKIIPFYGIFQLITIKCKIWSILRI